MSGRRVMPPPASSKIQNRRQQLSKAPTKTVGCSACRKWDAYNRVYPDYPKLFCSVCGRRLEV